MALRLTKKQKFSVIYHDIFDYPLDSKDLEKWIVGDIGFQIKSKFKIRESLFPQKRRRERISNKKLKFAKKYADKISRVPSVKGVFITGSLAMKNSEKHSDIDLLIITSGGLMWITRLLVYAILRITNTNLRKPGVGETPDSLCINMWMDEDDLEIQVTKSEIRNLFLAHEIAQIVPVVDRGEVYTKFLCKNKWVKRYWPNATPEEIRNPNIEALNNFKNSKIKYLNAILDLVLRTSDLFAYKLQVFYMQSRITRETITSTRAFFHPVDWSEKVSEELKKRGVVVE